MNTGKKRACSNRRNACHIKSLVRNFDLHGTWALPVCVKASTSGAAVQRHPPHVELLRLIAEQSMFANIEDTMVPL
jgi:hypothetical protein